jgi:GT2 family glycosyltransferase
MSDRSSDVANLRICDEDADPHVVAVVLSYNGRDDSLACLASLQHVTWDRLTVLLVDNGSIDGTARAVCESFPTVRLLREEENLGFAGGNNVGIRAALALGADYVFLLNNDTTIAPDAVARCVQTAQLHSDAGAVCPIVYFAEPPRMIWYAGAIFEPSRAHSGRMLGYRELDRGQFASPQETARAVGAAVLFPRAALEDVGLFDQELFFLYEDVDWSLRARRAGYRIFLAPQAKVWHRVSASAGGEHSSTIAYYDTRNHLVVCSRHAPLTGASSIARELGILAVHLAGARRAQQRISYVSAVLAGWRDARRGRLGARE